MPCSNDFGQRVSGLGGAIAGFAWAGPARSLRSLARCRFQLGGAVSALFAGSCCWAARGPASTLRALCSGPSRREG